MVMKMNKSEFIDTLSKRLSYSKEKCIIINDILERNFFISKKNKNKIIENFIQKLELSETEANYVYDVAVKIVNDEIKYKLKHPFKNQP